MISILKKTTLFSLIGIAGLLSTMSDLRGANERKGADELVPFQFDPSYVSRHDIVYLSPMKVPVEGFPLGNGKMGGLVWTSDQGIEFQIHKDDIWSNPESGGYGKAPRHAARVRVDFGVPVFSWIHTLNSFKGRLSLSKGEASFESKTNFGDVQVRTWLAQDRNVWVIECDGTSDTVPVSVQLERIGSRTYGGWYGGNFDQRPTTAGGGSDTRTTVNGKTVYLTEKGSGMDFVVGLRAIGGNTKTERLNRFSGEVIIPSAKSKIIVAVATGEDSSNPFQTVKNLLDGAERAGVDQLRKAKNDYFSQFWSKSFMHLGDDYLENLWYLRRYLASSGSRGKYPLIFNGGLWRWNRDVTNWVTPHHWNMQQQYWGLCAQNDVDLMRPYWETYSRMAEKPGMKALAAARGAKDDAILLAEMHNFDGTMVDQNRGDMIHTYTPAAQVASRFWEVYEFTKDKEFLKKTAYPFMQRAANFYLQKLSWDESRKVFTMSGFVYENGAGAGLTKEPESDREYIEDLFTSCLKAAKELGVKGDHLGKMQHVLNHLWPRLYKQDSRYQGGEIIAASNGGRYSSHVWAIGGLVAFPSGNIGIDQQNTREGKAVQVFIKGTESMYSHHPTAVIAARMGMGDEALRLLKTGVQTMQYFPSGLMFNCTSYPDKIYQLDHKTNMVGRVNLLWKDFYQCGMETTSLVSLTLTEMMLQSNEGKIRVFPAIPTEWKNKEMAFELLARGGFLVAANWKNSTVNSIGIVSTLGGICSVQNPWTGGDVDVRRSDGTTVAIQNKKGGTFSFETTAGSRYLITQAGKTGKESPVQYSEKPNEKPKKSTWGTRILGVEAGM